MGYTGLELIHVSWKFYCI